MGLMEINLYRINDICILFNMIIFLFIPLLLIMIRSIICGNVPKWDLYLAYNAIILYAQLGFYLWIYINWNTWIDDPDMDTTLGFAMFFIPSITNALVLISATMACCCLHSNDCWKCMNRSCSGVDQVDIYPLPREKTPESIRYLLNVIKITGPTMVHGKMNQTGSREIGDTKVYFYDCAWWRQFKYTSWRNASITGEEQVEKLLEKKDKTFVIRINVEFQPENEETLKKYEAWHSMEPSLGSCYKRSGR